MIVITGGAGFIGSNLAAGLEARGVGDIVICDVFGEGDKWRNIAKRGLRDIVHPDELFPYLSRHRDEIEMVFHMGAISATTERDVDLIVRTNFILSRDLWRWCAKNKIRLVYASSAATYGGGEAGFVDGDEPRNLAQLKPLNPYGWSKHAFDRRVSDIVHKSRSEDAPPQWAGLKFFNVYGPNEYHKSEQMSVVAKLYPQIAAGAAARLFKSGRAGIEDGGQLRDFVHVDDCVDVMLWLYDHPEISGLYNVGSGKARSFIDLARAAFAAAGIEPKVHFIDMPDQLKDKYQYFTEADISKLRAAGYDKPMTSLETGIHRLIDEYMSKDDPYR